MPKTVGELLKGVNKIRYNLFIVKDGKQISTSSVEATFKREAKAWNTLEFDAISLSKDLQVSRTLKGTLHDTYLIQLDSACLEIRIMDEGTEEQEELTETCICHDYKSKDPVNKLLQEILQELHNINNMLLDIEENTRKLSL